MRNDIMADNHNDRQMEELLRREFKGLPLVPAPATLVHRVMLAVHERARQPWWRRSWGGWPAPVRILFLVCASSCACGCVLALARLTGNAPVTLLTNEAVEQLAFLRPVWGVAAALVGALSLVVRTASPLVLWTGALILGALYATSVGLGTLCCRVALNKV